MRMIRRISAPALSSLVLAILFRTQAAFAAAGKFTNPIRAQSLDTLLVDILNIVVLLGAMVVVFFIILAGFKYVTARGDPGAIKEATQSLTGVAIGAAIVLGAKVIALVIQNTVNELGQ